MRRFILLALLMFAPMAYAQKTVVGKLDMQFRHTISSTVQDNLAETIMRLDVIIEPGARFVTLKGIIHAGQSFEGSKRTYSTRSGFPIMGTCTGLNIDTFSIRPSIADGAVTCFLAYQIPNTSPNVLPAITGYGIYMQWIQHSTNRVNGPKLIPTSRIYIAWPTYFQGVTGVSTSWKPKSEREEGQGSTYLAKDIILQDTLGIFSTDKP